MNIKKIDKFLRSKIVGLNYKHLGRGAEGVDCYGVIYYAYKLMGVTLPEATEYNLNGLNGEKSVFCERFSESFNITLRPQTFDVVLLQKGQKLFHLGLILPDNYVLHCLSKTDASVTALNALKKFYDVKAFFTLQRGD